jgi:hypothetical protein
MRIKKELLLGFLAILLGVSASLNFKYFVIGGGIIGLLILLMKLDKQLILLLLLVLVNESIFYFVEVRTGEILKNLMVLVILLIFVKELFNKRDNYMGSNKYNFKIYLISFFILIIIEIFNAALNYFQPISLGIASSKYYFIYLFYFILANWLLSGKVKKENVENVVIYTSFIASLVYIIQYLLYDNVQFLHVNFLERFGGVRFYQGINLILIGTIFTFNRLLTSSNKMIVGNAIILLINLFYIIYICNSRTITLPFLISVLITVTLQKRYNKYIFFYFMTFISIIMFTFIYSKGLYQDNRIVNLVEMSLDDILNKSGTFKVRLDEISFYFKQFIESPILGRGLLHEGNYYSYLALGKQYDYYLSDIGIFGFTFKFGLLGLVIIIGIILKYTKSIIMLWKNKMICYDHVLYIMYIIFAGLFVPIFDHSTNILYLAICFAIIDFNTNKMVNLDKFNLKT